MAVFSAFIFCNSPSISRAEEPKAEASKADAPKTEAAKPADTKAPAPILWWKLDDGKGASATDAGGKNNGELAGEVAWVTGRRITPLAFEQRR